MRSKQRGITLIGFVLVMFVVAVFAVIAMNLVPVYSEAFSVKKAMETLAAQPGADKMEIIEAQKALQKRFDIDYVQSVLANQAKLERKDGGLQLILNYEVRKPLVYNLDFVAKFDNTVTMGSAGTPAK
jgi:cell division protein FtsL